MPRYVVERYIPGLGGLSSVELQHVAELACSALRDLPDVEWLHSYITEDRMYCVFIAPDEAAIREHARRGGFPADRVSRLTGMADPSQAHSVT